MTDTYTADPRTLSTDPKIAAAQLSIRIERAEKDRAEQHEVNAAGLGDFDPSPGVDQAGRPSYPAIMITPNANRGEDGRYPGALMIPPNVEASRPWWQACCVASTESQYGDTAEEAYRKLETRRRARRASLDNS